VVGIEITEPWFLYMAASYINLNIYLKTEVTGYPKNYVPLYMMLEDHTLDKKKCWF
jgi:hypothetical protein